MQIKTNFMIMDLKVSGSCNYVYIEQTREINQNDKNYDKK